jgi:RNA polymerase sigma factor (sigma-70 family)
MVAATLVDESDQQLVEQFLARRDEAVFEALLRRHGPMVYRVCWRVLQQEQDAEDAFQATFLLMAQNLCTLRKRDSLGSWLHGVARRVALMAKARAALRRRHEQDRSQVAPPEEVLWKELRSVLDAELSRLPERWRLPLILCYLEGHSQEEAAAHLGWSRATLQRRLTDARTALARRLKQRGVWPAALSALLLSDCTISAAPAPGLVATTIEAAARAAAGRSVTSVASAQVAALAQGVMKAMFMTKLKMTAALVLLLVVGFGAAAMMTQAAVRPELEQKAAVQVALAPVREAKSNEKGDLRRIVQSATWFVMRADEAGSTISLQLNPTGVVSGGGFGVWGMGGPAGGGGGGPGAAPPAQNRAANGGGVWGGVAAGASRLSGIVLQLSVAKDAGIVIDGQEGKLADLHRGMQIVLQMAKERPTITKIEATTPGRTIVKAVDVEKKTITVTTGGQDWPVSLATEVKIAIAGTQEAKLSDLKAGMRVNLELAADEDRIVVKAIQASVE